MTAMQDWLRKEQKGKEVKIHALVVDTFQTYSSRCQPKDVYLACLNKQFIMNKCLSRW
jgi:hypothetical protein